MLSNGNIVYGPFGPALDGLWNGIFRQMTALEWFYIESIHVQLSDRRTLS